TLAFLADVPDRKLDDLVERLGRAASRRTAFAAAVAGGGAFPNVARARGLWAGVGTDGAGGAGARPAGPRAPRAGNPAAQPGGRAAVPRARHPRPARSPRGRLLLGPTPGLLPRPDVDRRPPHPGRVVPRSGTARPPPLPGCG